MHENIGVFHVKHKSKSDLEDLYGWQLDKAASPLSLRQYVRQYKVSREIVGNAAGVRKRLLLLSF
ncbi:hypothetical protein AB832_08360 [Flavobacteriaceae bacterium (ex Bugula neritina AB1)]|nr:hypothetical protein AB832_08360 [Flavobacteriaceae bacterium (ex Bugula neritina AB1)]